MTALLQSSEMASISRINDKKKPVSEIQLKELVIPLSG